MRFRACWKTSCCVLEVPECTAVQWFSKWAIWPSREPHQLSKRPQENYGKLGGHSKFEWDTRTSLSEYFKFTIESNVPFSPASPTAQKAKLYFISFYTYHVIDLVSVGWLIWCQKYVTALMLWGDVIFAYHWPHCNQSFRNLQVFIRPITNRIFLLV